MNLKNEQPIVYINDISEFSNIYHYNHIVQMRNSRDYNLLTDSQKNLLFMHNRNVTLSFIDCPTINYNYVIDLSNYDRTKIEHLELNHQDLLIDKLFLSDLYLIKELSRLNLPENNYPLPEYFTDDLANMVTVNLVYDNKKFVLVPFKK